MPSQMMPLRRFVITRVSDANGDIDPTAALDFFPAKDSDELYEALKEAFPHSRTHKERMRDAVIEFLLQERDDERRASTGSITAASAASSFTMPAASPSMWYEAPLMSATPSQESMQVTPEYLPSPESLLNNTFPSTPATVTQNEQISAIPNSLSVPGLKEMTNVWSVSSTVQPKVRTRRSMTDAEKKEYRKKRKEGACVECKRRRRKCDHNSECEPRSTTKKVRKASKPSIPAPPARPPVTSSFLEQSSIAMTPTVGWQHQEDPLSSMLLPASTEQFDFSGLDNSDILPDMNLFGDQWQQQDLFADFVDFSQVDQSWFSPQPSVSPPTAFQTYSPRVDMQQSGATDRAYGDFAETGEVIAARSAVSSRERVLQDQPAGRSSRQGVLSEEQRDLEQWASSPGASSRQLSTVGAGVLKEQRIPDHSTSPGESSGQVSTVRPGVLSKEQDVPQHLTSSPGESSGQVSTVRAGVLSKDQCVPHSTSPPGESSGQLSTNCAEVLSKKQRVPKHAQSSPGESSGQLNIVREDLLAVGQWVPQHSPPPPPGRSSGQLHTVRPGVIPPSDDLVPPRQALSSRQAVPLLHQETVLPQSARQEPGSGIIMPLPLSYATVSEQYLSTGGMMSSPASIASTVHGLEKGESYSSRSALGVLTVMLVWPLLTRFFGLKK